VGDEAHQLIECRHGERGLLEEALLHLFLKYEKQSKKLYLELVECRAWA
jgi:hypothetical protein